MNNTCVCCGRYVPEGRMVCGICENNNYDSNKDKIAPKTAAKELDLNTSCILKKLFKNR